MTRSRPPAHSAAPAPASAASLLSASSLSCQLVDASAHRKVVRCVRWNHDGSVLASASAEPVLRLARLAAHLHALSASASPLSPPPAQQPDVELRGHTASIDCLSWCPAPRLAHLLASCSADGSVRLWDTDAARCVAAVHTGGENLNVTWGALGALAVANLQNALTLVDADTGRATCTVDFSYELNELAFAPWSPWLLCAATGRGAMEAFDVRALGPRVTNPRPVASFVNHGATALALTFSADGRLAATGGADAAATVRDTAAMVPVAACARAEAPVRSVSFAQLGGAGAQLLACGGEDGHIDLHVVGAARPGAPCLHRLTLSAELNALHCHPTLPLLAIADASKNNPSVRLAAFHALADT